MVGPYLITNPTHPDILYFRGFTNLELDTQPTDLVRSKDGGRTWDSRSTPEYFIDIQPDPTDELGVFGLGQDELWYSSDAGDTWREILSRPGTGGIWGMQAHVQGILVYDGPERVVLVSRDRGVSWEEVPLPALSGSSSPFGPDGIPFVDPTDTRKMMMLAADGQRLALMKTDDGGQGWGEVTFPAIDSPAGALFSQHREAYRICCAEGELTASVPAWFRDGTESPVEFPTVGDWVAAQIPGDTDPASICAVLPRRRSTRPWRISFRDPHESGKTAVIGISPGVHDMLDAPSAQSMTLAALLPSGFICQMAPPSLFHT